MDSMGVDMAVMFPTPMLNLSNCPRIREALELTFKMIKADTQLLYSSDYPHWDMDLPSTIYDLPFLSEQAKRNILGGNAQRLFSLDPVYSPVKLARRAARATDQPAPVDRVPAPAGA